MISIFKNFFSSNKLIIENYFFMTFLQFLNSFLYLLIYPFLISKLGAENYGTYVFLLTFVTFLIYMVNFGFEIPALKKIVENSNNPKEISNIFSNVFFGKLYILVLSIFIFYLLSFLPVLNKNKIIFYILMLQLVASIFLPIWYFQALQKMKILTIIQVLFKVTTIPLIFFLVQNKNDLWVFSLIASFGVLFSALFSFLYVVLVDKVKISFKSLLHVKEEYLESLPYFISVMVSTIKDQIVVIILGVFFGMKEVALYDLAMKIISIPRAIFVSLNTAIFPKVMKNLNIKTVKKIIRIEYIMGISVILVVLFFGSWIVNLLGNGYMGDAYILSVILSGTVTVWLIVGCYIYFCFVPNGRSDLVYKNQVVALLSLLIFLFIGLFFYKNITIFAWAILLSGVCEIIYCRNQSRKLGYL